MVNGPRIKKAFIVHKILNKGAYHLNGKIELLHRIPINGKYLKKYYPTTWEMAEHS